MEYVILVDGHDRKIGVGEKVRCHMPGGPLHRAFTALLFDQSGRLALGRRSPSKMLWPGVWDGTFASHPREGETYVSSAERRMPEELGASCRLDYRFKFEYHAPYKNIGSENEVCGTVTGVIDSKLEPVHDEISEIWWVEPEEIAPESEEYCPWMLLAIYMLDADAAPLKRWAAPAIKRTALKGACAQIPISGWRRL